VKLTTTNGAGSNAAHVAAAAYPGLQARANTQNQFHLYTNVSAIADVLQLLLGAGVPAGALDGNGQGCVSFHVL
jgi:hypothetical protein